MATPPEPAAPPTDDPNKAELETLRQEKKDREVAEQAAKDEELETLRAFKVAQDAKTTVPAPVKKTATAPPTPPMAPPEKKRKARVSSKWFGEAAYDD
jgi:hypothetical protein